MSIIVYHAPGTCSRVTLNALEEAEVKFEDRALALLRGEQKNPQYLAVNSNGKVPALVIDGTSITENVAILHYLSNQYPDARLLPKTGNAASDSIGLRDLLWCTATLHPHVRQALRPSLFSNKDEAGVKSIALEGLKAAARRASDQIDDREWWYGKDWSIVDVYIYWIFSSAAVGGLSLIDYPVLKQHATRVRARPSFQRALAREKRAVIEKDIPLPFGETVDTL